MKDNKSKIIATIGPSCSSPSVILEMMKAGMDACRLNFSHGSYRDHAKYIQYIRQASRTVNREIAILQDLQGPKLRVGEISKQGIEVKKGEKLTLGKSGIPLQFSQLPHYVKNGERIFIDDGKIELRVLSKDTGNIFCHVETGGMIFSNKGLNVPDTHLPLPALTKKDFEDVLFGIRHGVDYIALSFVGSAKDVEQLRAFLVKHQKNIKIIAKIERKEAIANLEEIIEAADAVMVARGDLGIELPAEMVPLHQKKIIHAANRKGRPVIVATQMLASMVENPQPTRAEISDAANAIFDDADALMLSNETAVGKYPVNAVKVLTKVATAVEHELVKHPHLHGHHDETTMSLTDAACLSAVHMAADTRAKYLISLTKTGYTALEIAKNRPSTPLIVFTPSQEVARQLALVWGVKPLFIKTVHFDNPLPAIKQHLLAAHLAKKRDALVVCNAGKYKEKLVTSTVL